MKHVASILLASLLLACSPQPDYEQSVREFQALKNDGDLEGLIKLFADEPTLNFGPLGSIEGRPAVRGILEYDLALNTHLEFGDCATDGREVSCSVVESNDWLRTAGIASITYDENRFTFGEDGRIESVAATLSTESQQLMGAAVGEFHEWAVSTRPAEYGELFSAEGAFVYSRANAEKVLLLLSAWQAE